MTITVRQGVAKRRWAPILAGVLMLLAASVWIALAVDRHRRPDHGAADLEQLIAAIERGDPRAPAQAKALATRDWPASDQAVQAMFAHASWRVRAAACDIVGEVAGPDWVAMLVPRCSDAHWRVRDTATRALADIRPLDGPLPMRNTPLEHREQWLLSWLDAYDEDADNPLGPEICELYADAAHMELGAPLARRCLACHAGRSPQPFSASDECAGCHGRVHADWENSAHAQSLSHLRLTTVDPASREAQPMDFGPVRGIACTECHAVDPSPSTRPASPADRCAVRFDDRAPAADSCARCHATTHRQWQAWLKGPQARRAVWPPGQVETGIRGDTRTCVDCHMPPDPRTGLRAHRWSVRRDRRFLREGIDARIEFRRTDDGDREALLVLTNLSGHDYPTGTRRRALRIHAGAADAESAALLATLAPNGPGQLVSGVEGPLLPGQRRRYAIPVSENVRSAYHRIVYHRNFLDPDALVVELSAGASSPAGPIVP